MERARVGGPFRKGFHMSKPDKMRPRLGRGLSSLMAISDPNAEMDAPSTMLAADEALPSLVASQREPQGRTRLVPSEQIVDLPVAAIQPNPHQPRRDFDDVALAELAASLKSTGLIQPIVVREIDSGFELIAGERRLRAAKLAGLTSLPAVVKVVDGFTQAQMALVENIQREDLNAIDRASAYRTLMDQLGLTVSELATRIGEDRSSISNYLRLLELASPVRDLVRNGKLSMGHAKLLAGLSDPIDQQHKAELVVSQGLSVRNLESMIQAGPIARAVAPPAKIKQSNHVVALEKSISRQVGARVQVKESSKKGRGKLILHYANLDQFDQIMGRLGVAVEE